MSITLVGFMEFRKKILLALQAAKMRARADCIAGLRSALGPRTPSDKAMSPGPHSANAMPGTFKFCSAFSSAYLSSSFRPSKSSPVGLSGQAFNVVRGVLHVVANVVRPRLRIFFPLLEAAFRARMRTGVIDGLAL